MNCSNCGYANRIGVNFCEKCGSSLREQKQSSNIILCSQCGQSNRPGIAYCEYCGAKFDQKPIPQRETPAQPRKKRFRWLPVVGCSFLIVVFVGITVLSGGMGMLGMMRSRSQTAVTPLTTEKPAAIVPAESTSVLPNGSVPDNVADVIHYATLPEYAGRLPGVSTGSTVEMRNSFSPSETIYESENDPNSAGVYEKDEFRYVNINGFWTAYDAANKDRNIFFVRGKTIGHWEKSGNSTLFIDNGIDPHWVNSYFETLSELQKTANGWQLNSGADLYEWIGSQANFGGLWVEEEGQLSLMKTTDQNTYAKISLFNSGFKLASPPNLFEFDKWTVLEAIVAPIGGPLAIDAVWVIEHQVEGWDKGCGSKGPSSLTPDGDILLWAASGGLLTNFASACAAHDVCYEAYDATQAQCDDEFREDIFNACMIIWVNSLYCGSLAESYWAGVHFGGEEAFLASRHYSTDINVAFNIGGSKEVFIERGECVDITYKINHNDGNSYQDFYTVSIFANNNKIMSINQSYTSTVCPTTDTEYRLEAETIFGQSETASVYVLVNDPSPPSVTVDAATMCRKGPGKDYAGIGDLQVGEETPIVALYSGGDDYVVVENYGVGGTCWLYTGYATFHGDLSELAYWDAPALPQSSTGGSAGGDGEEPGNVVSFSIFFWNDSNDEICGLWIASASVNTYGNNLINYPISPGESYYVHVIGNGNPYDILARTCNNQDIIMEDVTLLNETDYSFTGN